MNTHRHDTIDPDAPPSVIERQLDAKRADLHDTLNQLEDRFNPEQVFDYVRENGGEIAGNLGRTFKQNPVPFLLTGVGLAWLMSAQSNANREPVYPRYRSDRYTGNPYFEDDDLDYTDRRPRRYGVRSTFADEGYGAHGYDDNDDDRESALDKVKRTASDAGDAISDAAQDVSTSLSDMTDDARARYESMKRDTSNRYARMSDASKRRYAMLDDEARARYDRAKGSARRAAIAARRRARSTSERGADFLKEQPLVAGAIGAAVGALIGSLLPPSRTEDRAFGTRADQLRGVARDELEQHASTAASHAQQVIEDAGSTAEQKLVEARKTAEQGARKIDAKAAEATDKHAPA